jgi:cephalosporin hydroxylase
MNEYPLNATEAFFRDRARRAADNRTDEVLKEATTAFLMEMGRTSYSFNFSWLGRPVIQIPQDLFAMQEIIWSLRPDFIIETGIAHGGSLIFYASILELVGNGKVIGIDIDIRPHNRAEIEKHPLSHRVIMIEGSSVSADIVKQAGTIVAGAANVVVCLDSDHTHDHVLKELELYTPFISKGGYCVVFDTGIEDLPAEMIEGRSWRKGNNPKTAVWEFLKRNDRFEIDHEIEGRLLITAAPDGYLRCVKGGSGE